MATFISDDGSLKIESVVTVDKGQWIQVELWTGTSWFRCDEIHIPGTDQGRSLSFQEQVDWLAHKLAAYGLHLVGNMIECDNPDWELDAMEVRGG